MTLFVLIGLCAGAGVLWVYRLARPARADLTGQVTSWDAARGRANRRVDLPAPASVFDRVARRVAEYLDRNHDRRLGTFNQDLAITETSMEAFLSKTIALTGIGFFVPIALDGLISVAGVGLGFQYALLAGIALAGFTVFMRYREIKEQAETNRALMRETISVFLDLVVMTVEAGRHHAEALPAAARMGDDWTWAWLQDACVVAPRVSGTTAWVALGQLGERIGMNELTEIEGTMTLANDDGAKILDSLKSRARTLRDKRIADSDAADAKNTTSMQFALLVMAFAFIVYEFYPAVSKLFTSG